MDRDNTNLLIETLEFLKESNKQPQDVLWCTMGDAWFTFDDFMEIAQGFDYDSGYGHQVVHNDLKIVGEDWWLERYEYDGCESWVFKQKPERSSIYRKPQKF